MRMGRAVRAVGVAVALAAGVLCGVRAASLAHADEGTILIGEYGSFTGPEATFGTSTHNGIMLAVEEINGKGGIKGKKVAIKHYDDQGKSQEAGTVVTRLVTQDKVVALLGEVASSLSIAGGRVAQKYGIPMVSPSSTYAQVTAIGDMIFRVCFVDDFQGFVGAKFAHENLKAKKVAILYDQGQAYSKGLKKDFEKAFKDFGGETTEQAYTGGDQDFSAQLGTIKTWGPDVIYVPGYYTEVGNIALQARKLGIKAPMLGGDGWDSAKLGEIGGAAIEGSYYTNHYAREETRPEVQEFVKTYEVKYKPELADGLAALGYDAAKILFDAIGRAPSTSGKDIAAALAATKDYKGVTGLITIDEKRNAKKPAVVVQMKGGQPVFAASVAPSAK